MTYQLLLLSRAEWDVDGILGFLARHSVQGAISWDEALQFALTAIQSDLCRFSLAPESSQHDWEIKQILFKTRHGRVYRVQFSVAGPRFT